MKRIGSVLLAMMIVLTTIWTDVSVVSAAEADKGMLIEDVQTQDVSEEITSSDDLQEESGEITVETVLDEAEDEELSNPETENADTEVEEAISEETDELLSEDEQIEIAEQPVTLEVMNGTDKDWHLTAKEIIDRVAEKAAASAPNDTADYALDHGFGVEEQMTGGELRWRAFFQNGTVTVSGTVTCCAVNRGATILGGTFDSTGVSFTNFSGLIKGGTFASGLMNQASTPTKSMETNIVIDAGNTLTVGGNGLVAGYGVVTNNGTIDLRNAKEPYIARAYAREEKGEIFTNNGVILLPADASPECIKKMNLKGTGKVKIGSTEYANDYSYEVPLGTITIPQIEDGRLRYGTVLEDIEFIPAGGDIYDILPEKSFTDLEKKTVPNNTKAVADAFYYAKLTLKLHAGETFVMKRKFNLPAGVYQNAFTENEDGTYTLILEFRTALPTRYMVEFHNGDSVEKVQVIEGECAAVPANPTKPWYVFTGWYKDHACTQKYDFSKPVTGNLTLYAGWKSRYFDESKMCTVTFHTMGVSVLNPPGQKTVYKGTKVEEPAPMQVIGKAIFQGWYLSPLDEEKYDFDTPVVEDFDLYAKWMATGGGGMMGGHVHQMISLGKEATCSSDGYKPFYVCESCGKYYANEAGSTELTSADIEKDYVLAKIGHEFGAYTKNDDATCHTDGTESAVCENCGMKDTRTVLGYRGDHKPAGTVYHDDTEHWKLCTECGEVVEKALHKDEDDDTLCDVCSELVPKEGMWIDWHSMPVSYTGKAIKPEMDVYVGAVKLVRGVDYTVTYKYNVNACTNLSSKKSPRVIVKGKGNYKGTVTEKFAIQPAKMDDAVFNDAIVAYTGKKITFSPSAAFNGKKMKQDTDYVLVDAATGEPLKTGKEAKTYSFRAYGKGNFDKTTYAVFSIQVVEERLISSCTISKIPAQKYTGAEVKPSFDLYYKKKKVDPAEYSVSYSNNKNVGTGTITVVGNKLAGGVGYVGTKKFSFTIAGSKMTDASIATIAAVSYNGKEIKPIPEVTMGDKHLVYGTDYTVSYKNNVKAGTAKLTVKGVAKKGYSGSKTVSFTIKPYNAKEDPEDCILINGGKAVAGYYVKGGLKVSPTVEINGVRLKQKTDYTMSWSNYGAISDLFSVKTPIVKITFKGNLTGTISVPYIIYSKPLEDVRVSVADKVWNKKAGSWKSSVSLTDTNGKKLENKKDYKIIGYYLDKVCTTPFAESYNVPETPVYVKLEGLGNYDGDVIAEYRIAKKSISGYKSKVLIDCTYTGKEIAPKAEEIQVYKGTEKLVAGVDYIVIKTSYKNNKKVGTASVQIRGIGNYSGTLTVKYTIKQKIMKWWESLLG